MVDNILEIHNISKVFPGVVAVDNVSFNIKRGSIHCIVGENGAGKSTFIKILTGALSRSDGQIQYDGKEYNPRSVKDAMNSGMSILYQELNVVDYLTVEQNLSLGKEVHKFGFVRKDRENEKAVKILRQIDPSIHLKQQVANLSVAQKQIIEIVKAIATEAKIIIMDEPTASITEEETGKLFSILSDLKKNNVTIIYISHRLDEIFKIGDEITVFRDGKVVATKPVSEILDKTELIKLMIGKVVSESYVPSKPNYEVKVLEARGLTDSKLQDISFALYAGEIVGFYGLVGAGKTEVAQALFGVTDTCGEIIIEGNTKKIKNPRHAINCGISMVPEERRTQGLFTNLTIRDNIPVMNMEKVSWAGIRSKRKETEIAKSYVNKMKIATPSEEKVVALLSGGNQQKVVIAKCLCSGSKVVLLDEPTRGVDVGAKEEIHNIIRQLAGQGSGVIVFSSELSEILNLCDRIFIMFNGKLKAEFQNDVNIDSDKILYVALGGE
jgi:ribose transport system ATP-binding protein